MHSTLSRRARAARLLTVIAASVLASAALVLAAQPALAHDELVASDPAADATVDASPAELTLTFSGAISDAPGASEVQVTDAAGTSLAGEPTSQDNVLTVPLTGDAEGVVTVLWKVVSSDGHPISGEYSFTVAGAPTTEPTPEPTETDTETAEPTPTAEPTETTAPVAPPADEDTTFAQAWPWVVGGILVAALAGAVLYLVTSRARREKALAAAGTNPATLDTRGDAPEAGDSTDTGDSAPPADR